MQISSNFVTMLGLTNDERALVHSVRVEKQFRSERIIKLFSNK